MDVRGGNRRLRQTSRAHPLQKPDHSSRALDSRHDVGAAFLGRHVDGRGGNCWARNLGTTFRAEMGG